MEEHKCTSGGEQLNWSTSHQGPPLSNKEEPTTDTANKLTAAQGNWAAGKEANGEGYKPYDPIDVTPVK